MKTSKSNQADSVVALDVPPRMQKSNYPEPFASRMGGRVKRPLGDFFGIQKFGVNLTELAPNSESALLHRHSKQEEFIYVIKGNPTLVTEKAEEVLAPGMCAGFSPEGPAHKIVNRTSQSVLYLEIGDRVEGDVGTYPNDDLVAVMDETKKWKFRHKDGRPY